MFMDGDLVYGFFEPYQSLQVKQGPFSGKENNSWFWGMLITQAGQDISFWEVDQPINFTIWGFWGSEQLII